MSKQMIILLGVVLFSLLVLWAESRHSSQIEDNIELRSQQALNKAKFTEVKAIADGRDVSLSGTTVDATRRVAAEALVLDLAGVRTVNNKITVPGGEDRNEQAAVDVANDAQATVTKPAYTFSVASRDDGIFLSGKVLDDAEKNSLEERARLGFPDQAVSNRLTVGAQDLGAANTLILPGLGMLAELSSGTLDVDARGLRVNGRVRSTERLNVLESKLTAARKEHPSLRVVSNIVVAESLDTRSCQAELNRLIESEKILFENEEAVVKEASHELLNNIADVSQRCDAHIEIGGHTDSYGDDAYNHWLSEQRAGAVRGYLIQNGVAAERLSSVGYGESQPIAENSTRAQRAKNRRIEFLVTKLEGARQ